MAEPILISPSLLSADFARLADEIRRVEAAGADWHHVDVMDGHFVPNLTIGPPVVAALHKVARRPLDVHLMIRDPIGYAPEFVAAGAHVLTFHWEATGPRRTGEAIRRYRELAVPVVGISINPDTRPEVLEPFLPQLDLVLVMSVYPGFGGQSFLPETLEKVRWLRSRGFRGRVEMDGGLNAETLPRCAAAGADVLVSGSAIFGSPDLPATIRAFREAALAARPQPAQRP
jgi:ribulose-phosphate 3-epimerase